ncbi:SPOR domain-containing protein [Paenibacillus sp. MBLB4367]|uniref:SPOR domain-containing protein n=1 Tax=Paenibacillus sp. MBLB4367 TaxID=3384767 RepID=UPI00390840A8
MQKSKITYRINNRDQRPNKPEQTEEPKVIQLREEEFRVEKAAREINPYTNDYGAWDSPYDAETRRIEQLIRESNERKQRPSNEPGTGRASRAENRDERFERDPQPFGRGEQPDKKDIVRGAKSEMTEWPEPEEPTFHAGTGMEEDDEQGGSRRYSQGGRGENRYRDTRYDPVSGYYGAECDHDRKNAGFAGVSVTGSRYIRHTRTPWMKITASVTGAVVTGVALGFFVLSMFSDDKAAETDKLPELNGKQETAVSAPNQTGTSGAGDAGKKQTAASGTQTGATGGSVAASSVAVNIPARSYTVLQGGSFATAQGAETAQADLRKKGLAAVTETTDKSYVYIGLAANKESAQALSKQLQAEKTDIYVKAYTLPELKSVRWSGSKDALQNYLTQSDKLVQMASKLTLMHLEETSLTPLDDATVQSVKTAHEAWTQAAAGVADGAQEEAKAQINKMNNAMNSVKKSIDEYKKTPSSTMLWQAQTYMMQFVLAEKELLQTINAQS